MTTVPDNSPRAPVERRELAREVLVQHTTIFLNSTGTNGTAILATLRQKNKFFLVTAQHVASSLEKKGEKWSYRNPALVVRYLDHPPVRADLGSEAPYSQDLTLFELHAEDAAEMVRLGLRFYDLNTSQYSSDEEYGPDYFIIGTPKSTEFVANRELNFEIRSAGVNILEELTVDGDDAPRFVEVEAVKAPNYSGMSGGGLWEISYPASGGHSFFLVGVVVEEPRELQSTTDSCSSDGPPTIRCTHNNQLKSWLKGLLP